MRQNVRKCLVRPHDFREFHSALRSKAERDGRHSHRAHHEMAVDGDVLHAGEVALVAQESVSAGGRLLPLLHAEPGEGRWACQQRGAQSC